MLYSSKYVKKALLFFKKSNYLLYSPITCHFLNFSSRIVFFLLTILLFFFFLSFLFSYKSWFSLKVLEIKRYSRFMGNRFKVLNVML